LEVGVKTDTNLAYYLGRFAYQTYRFQPANTCQNTAKGGALNLQVNLQQIDVQQLEFPDNALDTVTEY